MLEINFGQQNEYIEETQPSTPNPNEILINNIYYNCFSCPSLI